MAEVRVEVPITKAEGFFSLSPSQFLVSAPTPDGALQILFCDDFVGTAKMVLTGEESEGAVTNVQAEFVNSAERVAFGRIKLTATKARELKKLLEENLAALESSSVDSEG